MIGELERWRRVAWGSIKCARNIEEIVDLDGVGASFRRVLRSTEVDIVRLSFLPSTIIVLLSDWDVWSSRNQSTLSTAKCCITPKSIVASGRMVWLRERGLEALNI